jgi:hypothetical protein
MNFAEAQKYKETRAWTWARASWMGELFRSCRGCKHEFLRWIERDQVALLNVAQLARSIEVLRARDSDAAAGTSDTEAPIFLLSTGWRTGSTLLQRILVSDPRLLVWGEPLGEMTLVPRMAEMVSNSLSPRDLKLWYQQDDQDLSSLTTSWIATLSPPGKDLRSALRSLFDQWLGEPARRLGFVRWGLKEVRLGAAEAILLHWLFPRAKFVFISRHPYDCYRSFADSTWQRLYYSHPEVCIDSAAAFARHWNRLALGWLELPEGFPSFHIKYEDLISGKVDFRKLESWLGIEIREDAALSTSVGGTAVRSRLNWYEHLIISREAASGMQALGYSK